jgi:small subunit ribosomal protein S2
MSTTTVQELLNAGVHFGHLKRKWNPSMAPYIFMEKDGIHIIDLQKTLVKLDEATLAMKQIAKSGRKILFVATKKQAKDIVADRVKQVNMPYVTERWPGGMLTNFPTIRKAVKKMTSIDKMATDGTFDNLSKREKLQISRQRAKLEKNLGSIADLTRLPAAMFIVDITKEHIAVREARRLNIPIFAMVDTNSDPKLVDFPIPANDDASKSISLIVDIVSTAIQEGLEERKIEREKEMAVPEKKGKKETTDEETEEEDVDVAESKIKSLASKKPIPMKSAAKKGAKIDIQLEEEEIE